MTPSLVQAPIALPVTLEQAKAQLRVDHAAEDDLILGYIEAATAMLDGWGGQLGRCIMAQTWEVSAPAAGTWELPMPDVTSAVATYEDASIEALTVIVGPSGPEVTVAGPARVEMTCEMAPSRVPAARAAILMIVASWYAGREAVGGLMREVPMGAGALIDTLRVRRS